MPDFIFDGANRVIQEPLLSGDTTLDVRRDVYSAWKRWAATEGNRGYVAAFEVEGGTPIGQTGLFTGTTFVLVNGWKIRPADYDHQLLLSGNLYSDDGVVSVPALTASATIFVNSSVAAQGIATAGSTGGFTSQDRADLALARDHARAANTQTQKP